VIKFTIGKREYAMVFQHRQNEFNPAFLNPRTEIGGTVCRIYELGEDGKKGEEIAYGASYLHPNDNLNKETGRKMSLSRALAGWTKKDRTKVWEFYRNRPRTT
jgi:hypothetical protein